MSAWSPQQVAALDAVGRWLKEKDRQVFYLAGFAGTGKTTLARHIAEQADGEVCFGAFTGKAALMMRSKGCAKASTIHSLIYNAEEDEKTGLFEYKLNAGSSVGEAALTIIDECSMVDEALGRDLLSFKTPVLVLGDPFQLPPVSGSGYFTSGEPDMLLTEVHRQARDNPIIRLSMDIREGKRLQPGSFGASSVIRRETLTARDVLEADQVIVGRNATRQRYNERIRELRFGAKEPVPVKGERLICLKNKRPLGLLNGGMWETKKVSRQNDMVKLRLDPLDEAGSAKACDVTVPVAFFEGREQELDRETRRFCEEFTFGHAITCHKAQGSQWDKVIIFDEGGAFREQAARWRYTAVTRAAKQMTVVLG